MGFTHFKHHQKIKLEITPGIHLGVSQLSHKQLRRAVQSQSQSAFLDTVALALPGAHAGLAPSVSAVTPPTSHLEDKSDFPRLSPPLTNFPSLHAAEAAATLSPSPSVPRG